MADALYIYRCPSCRLFLTATMRAMSGQPYHCRTCGAPLPFQWEQPIETDEHRALAARGLTYGYTPCQLPQPAPVIKKCSTCRQPLSGDVIDLSGVGIFCSAGCADTGVAEHERFMQRVEALYKERPWLKPA